MQDPEFLAEAKKANMSLDDYINKKVVGGEIKISDSEYKKFVSEKHIPESIFINTYDDHRMAMAFAPLALIVAKIEFEDADVVEKSYPAFWKDLEKAGFYTEVKS